MLVIDNFAGGGGASTGLEFAFGRPVDIAINHSKDAIALHKANHPNTKHYIEDVWSIDPKEVTKGLPVSLVWLSPDCTHFSKAKGGKPVKKNIRGLAWIALRWAGTVRPRVIILENVQEFQTWGPIRRGKPITSKKSETYQKFIKQFKALGYRIETQVLVAADYGAPTSRKRFFLIARCDGQPIVWPEAMYAPREKAEELDLPPYRSAASIIDFSIPCPSIFDRKKPLAEATQKRIARGLKKFVFDEPNMFIVQIGQNGFSKDRSSSINDPLKTIVSKNEFCLIKNFLIPIGYGESKTQLPRVHDLKEPIPTIVGTNKHFLITPFLTKTYTTGDNTASVKEPLATITGNNHHYLISPFLIDYHHKNGPQSIENPYPTITSVRGHYLVTPHILINNTGHPGAHIKNPLPTITTGNNHYLTCAFLGQTFGGGYKLAGKDLRDPLPTVTAVDHSQLVKAFLVKYYKTGDGISSIDEPAPTITSKDRLGLVQVEGINYQIHDIGMRMLVPRELYNANGFPPDYIIDRDYKGRAYSKTKQVKAVGNSVPPPFAEALARANLPDMCVGEKIITMQYLKEYQEEKSCSNALI